METRFGALVLLSGGLDSAVAAALQHEISEVCPPQVGLFVDYGQRCSQQEKHSARQLADAMRMKFVWISLDSWGKALVDVAGRGAGTSILEGGAPVAVSGSSEEKAPHSYVPGRNTVLLALAQSVAEAAGLGYIVSGMSQSIGIPDVDNWQDYVAEWNRLATFATKAGRSGNPIWLATPLMFKTKDDVIKEGHRLGVPMELTVSCFAVRDGKHCGKCAKCYQRHGAFTSVGIADPTSYNIVPE